MKFQVNDAISYDGLKGRISNFYEKTEEHKKVFEGEFKIDKLVKFVLFDKEGIVKPFTANTNQPRVERI